MWRYLHTALGPWQCGRASVLPCTRCFLSLISLFQDTCKTTENYKTFWVIRCDSKRMHVSVACVGFCAGFAAACQGVIHKLIRGKACIGNSFLGSFYPLQRWLPFPPFFVQGFIKAFLIIHCPEKFEFTAECVGITIYRTHLSTTEQLGDISVIIWPWSNLT